MAGRILVVDDDAATREFLEMALSDEGYVVSTVPNGAVALEQSPSFRPDVILLDMNMPVMNGAEFVEAYNQTPAPRATIYLMTASAKPDELARKIGVAGFVLKPFSLDDLFNLLKG
jgi:CheY-like chemotaxis protein